MTDRELIRGLRAEVMSWTCACGGPGVEFCRRCALLGMIDAGLAEIGQTNKEMMADAGYKAGAATKAL